jgi:hypothetical protein
VSSAPSVAPNPILRLTNDTNATVTVTDCGGSAPTGCVVKSTVVVAPGKQADFPRPAIAAGIPKHGHGCPGRSMWGPGSAFELKTRLHINGEQVIRVGDSWLDES